MVIRFPFVVICVFDRDAAFDSGIRNLKSGIHKSAPKCEKVLAFFTRIGAGSESIGDEMLEVAAEALAKAGELDADGGLSDAERGGGLRGIAMTGRACKLGLKDFPHSGFATAGELSGEGIEAALEEGAGPGAVEFDIRPGLRGIGDFEGEVVEGRGEVRTAFFGLLRPPAADDEVACGKKR